MSNSTFITRVRLNNYKSIATCDVRLYPLMFLVGPNGAGKSNFLDALHFVADALRVSLDHALRDRGGINEVRRRSTGHPTHFRIHLDFKLSSGATGDYSFRVRAKSDGGIEVQEETCRVLHPEPASLGKEAYFRVQRGAVTSSAQAPPPAAADRLYLVNASGLPEFRLAYEELSRMGFYNLNPDRMSDLQLPDPGELLKRDGSNLASVFDQLGKRNQVAKRRIEEFLAKVVPGIVGVDSRVFGPRETLEFQQEVRGSRSPWRFLAANMSDGTLRVLGILVALFQLSTGGSWRVPLVGIEEPEIALHPGASGVLRDSIHEASQHTQIILTSHSPDLLDDDALDPDSILVVAADAGVATINPLGGIGRSALYDQLYTAGELLRLGHLAPPVAPPEPEQPPLDAPEGT